MNAGQLRASKDVIEHWNGASRHAALSRLLERCPKMQCKRITPSTDLLKVHCAINCKMAPQLRGVGWNFSVEDDGSLNSKGFSCAVRKFQNGHGTIYFPSSSCRTLYGWFHSLGATSPFYNLNRSGSFSYSSISIVIRGSSSERKLLKLISARIIRTVVSFRSVRWAGFRSGRSISFSASSASRENGMHASITTIREFSLRFAPPPDNQTVHAGNDILAGFRRKSLAERTYRCSKQSAQKSLRQPSVHQQRL